jgi:diguanylate cyclase (GGDEF)-like protein
MLPAPIPEDDAQRLAELHALGLLDSASEPAFDRVTRLAQRMFDVPTVLVSLIDKDRQWFSSNIGLDATETPRDISFCGHAITGEDVFVIEDASGDERFADNPLVEAGPQIRFYAGAPIRTPSGAAIGTLCLIDSNARGMTQHEVDNLADLAEIINAQIAQMCVGNTDALTGLLNRRGLFAAGSQLLAIAKREEAPISLAYLDLDGLKLVNDAYGHEWGDRLICSAGRLLSNAVRASDVACRLGGDEFAVLYYGLGEENFDRRHQRILDDLAHHNASNPSDAPISFSVGYVEWSREETLAELLARGDAAMYFAKARRRDVTPKAA